MINVQIKNFIISYYFIVKFCRDFFDTFPCAAPLLILCISPPCCVHLLCLSLTCSLPAVYIHYFSPPLLCVCLPSISLPLLLREFTASPPPPVRASILHLPLLLQCTWAFSQQLLLPFILTFLCLPSLMPSPLFFIPSFVQPLFLFIFILFSLPSFWYSGSFCLLICTTLLSGSPLHHFSPVLSDLLSQIDSTGKMFLFAGVCKPALQTIQHCVKSEVVSLIPRRILASCHHECRVKSPKTLSCPFFPLIWQHCWVHLHVRQSIQVYEVYAFKYLQGSYWQKKMIYYDTNLNCCSLGHKRLNMCFNWYKIMGQNQIQMHPMIFHLSFQLMCKNWWLSHSVINKLSQLSSFSWEKFVNFLSFSVSNKSLEKFKTDHRTPRAPAGIPSQPGTFSYSTNQCCPSLI